MGRFDGQVAFITGASAGIGAALARELARQGADVALAARRTDRLAALATEIGRGGRRAVALPCDVTADGDLERAVARARETLGRIDLLVANAGFGVIGRLDALTLEDYRRQFETNVFGVLRTIYAGLDELKRTRGRLVIIGSVAGYVGLPGSSPYAMSKFAVRALAQVLTAELARDGIAVTLVSPGLVESELRQVDNFGVRHAAVADPMPVRIVMPAARAARLIAGAVARGRREIVITGHGKVAVLVERHAPWLLAWAVRRLGLRSRGSVPRSGMPTA